MTESVICALFVVVTLLAVFLDLGRDKREVERERTVASRWGKDA